MTEEELFMETSELARRLKATEFSLKDQPAWVTDVPGILGIQLPRRYGKIVTVPNYVGEYFNVMNVQMQKSKQLYGRPFNRIALDVLKGFVPITRSACSMDFANTSIALIRNELKKRTRKHLIMGDTNRASIDSYLSKELSDQNN